MLKRHVLYFIAVIFFSFVVFIFVPIQIEEYLSIKKQSDILLEEITELEERKRFVEGYKDKNMTELVATVNSLLPSVEDKFSIFNSLDRLELATGVRVTSFSSPFRAKKEDQVAVKVQTFSSKATMLAFLEKYQFVTRRFMLLDGISYNPDKSSLSFTAIFPSHNVEINAASLPKLNAELIDQLAAIQSDVFSFPGETVINNLDPDLQNVNYSPRSNPFGNEVVPTLESSQNEATDGAN